MASAMSELSRIDFVGHNGMGRWREVGPDQPVRVVAWDFVHRPYPAAGDLNYYCKWWHDLVLDPAKYDMQVHKLFCAGHIPSAVYADWVEENGILLPPPVMDLLRGW